MTAVAAVQQVQEQVMGIRLERLQFLHISGKEIPSLQGSALLLFAFIIGKVIFTLPRIQQLMGPSLLMAPQSFLWCAFIFLIIRFLPRQHFSQQLMARPMVQGMAIGGAMIFLALRFCIGLFLKDFGNSPYDLTMMGILSNSFNLLPFLFVCEMVRGHVLAAASLHAARPQLWIAGVTILLPVMELNYMKMTALEDSGQWFVYLVKEVGPLFVQSCLLTVLVLGGGALCSILYSGLIIVVLHTFPILPVLPWIAEGALGLAFPIFFSLVVWERYNIFSHRQRKREKEPLGSFLATLIVAVLSAWFVVGVFPVRPAVVLTGSMEPMIFPGDVVLIGKFLDVKEVYALAEGDVICFNHDGISITHRIIAVETDDAGNLSFQTKGDNNKSADTFMTEPEDLSGRIINVIPKIGAPVLWLKGQGEIPEGVVDE